MDTNAHASVKRNEGLQVCPVRFMLKRYGYGLYRMQVNLNRKLAALKRSSSEFKWAHNHNMITANSMNDLPTRQY